MTTSLSWCSFSPEVRRRVVRRTFFVVSSQLEIQYAASDSTLSGRTLDGARNVRTTTVFEDSDRLCLEEVCENQLTSPLVSRILGAESSVHGKAALRAYFVRGLETYPDLKFDFWGAYPGHESLIVHYESVRGLRAAEYMRIDGSGRVCQVIAHYASPAPAR
jgi:hypothetical protein